MEAVILAAGMGTRLGSLIPKPLTSIQNEKTIMDLQIEKLSLQKEIQNIFLVVGYKKEIIMEKFPDSLFAYNSAYARTNTAKSLLTALTKINDDVLWMNGDVYFDEEILDLMLESSESACLVNKSECNSEEIKYNLTPEGYIKNISKSVDPSQGEALGINLIRKKDLEIFRSELNTVADTDYFEKALENLTVAGKIKLKPLDVGSWFCREIDFEQDLLAVQKYHLNKNKRKD
ncbi:NTP transferase domain-containing protein [Thermodesulfobacteriota bacterium]